MMSDQRIHHLSIAISLMGTLLLGGIVLFALPIIFKLIASVSAHVPWRLVLWLAVAALYFYLGIFAWRERLPAIIENLHQRSPLSVIGNVAVALFQPIPQIFLSTIGAPFFLLMTFLAKVLHPDLQKILYRCAGILCVIWISIYLILLYSNLWQPNDQRCKWVFPKITSCVLTKHEGLAGGLIGGGSAIFAAWLAWTAIQRQLEKRNEAS